MNPSSGNAPSIRGSIFIIAACWMTPDRISSDCLWTDAMWRLAKACGSNDSSVISGNAEFRRSVCKARFSIAVRRTCRMQKQTGDKPLRSGFTTGACAAAAARAASQFFLRGIPLQEIDSILPNRQTVRFNLNRCQWDEDFALTSIIKDGGDDPDCTHGAEIIARVRLHHQDGLNIYGGTGIARVTKPGLGLDVGTSAINPVPRQNIAEMVRLELDDSIFRGADIEISCPDGEERAKKTLNARLGLLGGISILGTTGIVLPYSTSAFIASIVQAIQLAQYEGQKQLVFTTGGR